MNNLPIDIIANILSFLRYDKKYYFINKKFSKAYSLTNKLYGLNCIGIKFKVIIEISDHDGYCSNGQMTPYYIFVNKCVYECDEYYVDIDISKKYNIDKLQNKIEKIKKEIKMYIEDKTSTSKYEDEIKYLKPILNKGSMYCDLSEECKKHGMDKHECRVSVYYHSIY
jgi:hypothetical protein